LMCILVYLFLQSHLNFYFYLFYFGGTGFELRVLHLQGRHSTLESLLPTFFVLGISR
jgi:hypothetical protein